MAGELGRVAREPEVLERDLARVAGAEARRDDGVSLEAAAHRPVNHAAMTSRFVGSTGTLGELERTRVLESPTGVTHLRYSVKR